MDYINILFLDIETVGGVSEYDALDHRWQKLWDKKAERIAPDLVSWDAYAQRAGIFSEFGRVVCISFGFIHGHPSDLQMKVKSLAGEDERSVLAEFGAFLSAHYDDTKTTGLCGHNVREFDIPYICRRMVKHGVPLPKALQIHGKKPWELEHIIDTLQLWKFGDYKHYTSLDLLSAMFDIPTPKGDIDGSQVHSVFYEDGDLARIVRYCMKDVATTARVYLHMMHGLSIEDDSIEYVEWSP